MDQKLDLILKELQSISTRLQNFEQKTNSNFVSLNEKVSSQHIENINADNLLLNEIRSLREGVFFVNRKVADAELEINNLKHNKQ